MDDLLLVVFGIPILGLGSFAVYAYLCYRLFRYLFERQNAIGVLQRWPRLLPYTMAVLLVILWHRLGLPYFSAGRYWLSDAGSIAAILFMIPILILALGPGNELAKKEPPSWKMFD